MPTLDVNDTERCFVSSGRHSSPWYCVWTKPNQERMALTNLTEAGFPSFLPLHAHKWSNRQIRIDPLFPRYLFAQPNDDGQWSPMLHQRGVAGLLRLQGLPRHVPAEVIATLQAQCSDDGVIWPPDPIMLRVAQPARVTQGPFAEFIGVCARTARDRVWLLLDLMGRQTEIGFAREAVEPV